MPLESTGAESTPASTGAPAATSTPSSKGPSPIGADLSQRATVGAPGQVSSATGPMDISDDTFVRIPGQDQPVKYGELYKRLQGDYTKKTQTLSQQRAAFDAQVKAFNDQKNAQELSLRNTAAALLQRGQQGNGQPGQAGNDFLSNLEKRPYLDGATAAQIVRSIQQEGFGSVVKAITDRDTIIQNFHQRLGQLQSVVDQLSGVHSAQSTETKINGWMQEAEIPAEAMDFVKDLYSAYEGEDLDNEFPRILSERWTQVQNILRNRDNQRVEQSRRNLFPLPGRGGNGSPSKALPTLRGDENAREMADVLWGQLQAGAAT